MVSSSGRVSAKLSKGGDNVYHSTEYFLGKNFGSLEIRPNDEGLIRVYRSKWDGTKFARTEVTDQQTINYMIALSTGAVVNSLEAGLELAAKGTEWEEAGNLSHGESSEEKTAGALEQEKPKKAAKAV